MKICSKHLVPDEECPRCAEAVWEANFPDVTLYHEIPVAGGAFSAKTASEASKTFTPEEWDDFRKKNHLLLMSVADFAVVKIALQQQREIIRSFRKRLRQTKPVDYFVNRLFTAGWHIIKRTLVALKLARPVNAVMSLILRGISGIQKLMDRMIPKEH